MFKKNSSRKYFLKGSDDVKVNVCKSFFNKVMFLCLFVKHNHLNNLRTYLHFQTLKITDARIEYILKKKSHNGILFQEDKRGKNENRKKTAIETVNKVVEFLNSLARYKSINYQSISPKDKRYLTSALNMETAYSEYNSFCSSNDITAVSSYMFRDIFYRKTNLKLKQKNTGASCNFCLNSKKQMNSLITTASAKLDLIQERASHLQLVEYVSRDYRESVEISKNTTDDTIVIALSYGKPIETPKISNSVIFYKQRLHTYYLCVHDIPNNRPLVYLWHEGIASNGSAEAGSCLIHFLKHKLSQSCKHIIVHYEGRHFEIKTMLLSFLSKSEQLCTITQVFHVPGHSLNLCTSKLKLIQKEIKKTDSIYVPEQWTEIITKSKVTKPSFEVIPLSTNHFLNPQEVINLVSNRNKDTEGDIVNWSEVHKVIMKKDNKFHIEVSFFNDLHSKYDESIENQTLSTKTISVCTQRK